MTHKSWDELDRESDWTIIKWYLILATITTLIFGMFAVTCNPAHAGGITASWYSEASCRREGTSGIMANGRKLNDNKFTGASWDYKFGTIVRVTNLKNGKSILVSITDRGPARRLYRQGRVVDLSVASFKAIANLKDGIIPIKIEIVKNV